MEFGIALTPTMTGRMMPQHYMMMDSDAPDFDPNPPCTIMEMLDTTEIGQLRDLVEMYTQESAAQLQVLKAAAEAGHLRVIADLAHTMAGSAATFGLRRVFLEACALEAAADDLNFRQISVLEQDLRTSFPLGLRALKSFLGGL